MIYTSIRAIAKLKEEVWYEAKRLGPDGSEVVRLIEEANRRTHRRSSRTDMHPA
jgi:hypothetical protein